MDTLADLVITTFIPFLNLQSYCTQHQNRPYKCYSVIAITLRYVIALLHNTSLWRNIIASDSYCSRNIKILSLLVVRISDSYRFKN